MDMPNPKSPRRILNQFGSQVAVTVLVLLLLVGIYSFFTDPGKSATEIPLSEVARQISAGEIKSLTVNGDTLSLVKKTGEEETSKKESEASLSESLINYGVTPAQLAAVPTEIKSDTGVSFWLLNLLPIILPVVFLLFLFWLISRQVKGASMQAFTFGQSKAKIIDPADTTQRITFKDVAGVREAKEELLEIVDFLKNPKKFLDIGARIPKGERNALRFMLLDHREDF
jgi:cell division protease FtsH